jgi:hypothetical protein
VACDATVNVKAKSAYSYGAYRLSQVIVSDLGDGNCAGKNLIVGVADIDQGTYQQSEIGFFNYGTPLTAEATLTSASENCAADFTCEYNSGTGTLTITVGTGAGGGSTYWQYDSRTRSTEVGDILIQQANAG